MKTAALLALSFLSTPILAQTPATMLGHSELNPQMYVAQLQTGPERIVLVRYIGIIAVRECAFPSVDMLNTHPSTGQAKEDLLPDFVSHGRGQRIYHPAHMAYDPQIHHRRSIRLREYDYSWPGWYYVTIVVKDRQSIFGEIVADKMHLNEIGKIVEEEWLKTPAIRSNVELDDFVVMPNHLHGIVIINDTRRGVSQYAPTEGFRSPSQSLGAIIRGFKSSSTNRINLARATPYLPAWQRNYHEHIIRNDADLHRIRQYIRNNPLKWDLDEENPDNQG